MSLTAQQKTDIRYFMGYSLSGSAAYLPYRELAYSDVSYMGIALDTDNGQGGRLQNLSPEEETRVTGYFLKNLYLREQEIQDATANLDTDKAAIWTHNKGEMGERIAAFTNLRLSLCHFLGFPPGSGLRSGNTLVRS